jgi:hypothetical protein
MGMGMRPDFVPDMRHTLRHRREPGEQHFPPFGAKIGVAGLWTPGANLTRQFDLDRYFLNGSCDAVATEITDKAIGSDPHIAPLLGRGELLGGGVVELLELPAIWQREIDGDPRCERSIRAHVRLGIEDHDDGSAVIEMGIEVPSLMAAFFRADTLAILELSHFDGIDAKFLMVGRPARADLSDPTLKDRIAELKAIRDQARADAARPGHDRARRAEHHTVCPQDVRHAGPQAHANRDWRLPSRSPLRARPARRSRRERSSHHGIERRATAHARRRFKRKNGGFWRSQF